MTNLHSLIKITRPPAKRLGRGLGSAKGSKSGRGTTRHQRARTTIPLHFEGGQGRIVKKYPLLRGKSKNKSVQTKPYTLRLSRLAQMEVTGLITLPVLIEKSIVPHGTHRIKVVFDGEIDKALQVKLPVSSSTAEAIRKAGGSIVD